MWLMDKFDLLSCVTKTWTINKIELLDVVTRDICSIFHVVWRIEFTDEGLKIAT